MGKPANFEILSNTPISILLCDIGPWNIFFTITNDLESVIDRLIQWGHIEYNEFYNFKPGSKRVFYIDSEGEITEIIFQDGKLVSVPL